MGADQGLAGVFHAHDADVAARESLRTSRYSFRGRELSSWAGSRMIGLLAKKFGDRASQPSSASYQSANGSAGVSTNAISEWVRRFSVAEVRT